MEKYHFIISDGSGYGMLYRYKNEPNDFVMSDLSVLSIYRRKGIGLFLQKERENLAKELGGKKMFLFVRKKSWMEEWYKKRGYVYYDEYTEDDIWMIKDL